MELSLLAVILGFILDLIVGDPHWLYHPIRLVGHLISGLEKLLRSIFPKTEQGELIAGGRNRRQKEQRTISLSAHAGGISGQ